MERARKVLPLKFSVSGLIAASLIFGCGGSDYSHKKDLKALNRIQKIWTAEINGKLFTISFCENISQNKRLADHENCMLDHVVRSENFKSGDRHGNGIGCSGCMHEVITIVTATVTDVSGETLSADSQVRLRGGKEHPYDGDYEIAVGGGHWLPDDPWTGDEYGVDMVIKEDGSLVIKTSLLAYLGYDAESAVTIEAPAGDAECPAPEENSSDVE